MLYSPGNVKVEPKRLYSFFNTPVRPYLVEVKKMTEINLKNVQSERSDQKKKKRMALRVQK